MPPSGLFLIKINPPRWHFDIKQQKCSAFYLIGRITKVKS